MDNVMHPSINSPLNFTVLNPQESPKDPYSPCWCMSGKKWKFCHKTRAFEVEIHEKEYQRLVRKNYNQGNCLHPDAGPERCSAQAINSHTIQMSGGISTISESQHVYTFKLVDSIDSSIYAPKKISMRKASTFLGFCSTHDSALFKCIETHPITVGHLTAFYMSYRAISYEYHGKMRASAAIPIMLMQDRGKPFEKQAWLQNFAHISAQGYKTGLKIHKQLKEEYDQAHLAADFSKFNFYAIEFETSSPIVACGAFCPEFDINNKPLQVMARGDCDYQIIAFNLLNINGRSYAIFGWLDDPYGVAQDYIKSIKSHPETSMADLIFKISFQNLENTYMMQSWWDNLGQDHQQAICELFRTGLGEIPKTAKSLHTPIPLWTNNVIRHLP